MILWLLSNTLQHVDFMNSKKLFLESLSKGEWAASINSGQASTRILVLSEAKETARTALKISF